jgi:hypothetical protein
MYPLKKSYENWSCRVDPMIGLRMFYCLAQGNYHLKGKEKEDILLSLGDWTCLSWKKTRK